MLRKTSKYPSNTTYICYAEPTATSSIFRWFIPVVCDYSISIDKVSKSKHNKTLLRYKESKDKDRQHVSALFIRPSSGLTWGTKEESQYYMVPLSYSIL